MPNLSIKYTCLLAIPIAGLAAMALPIEIRELLYLHLDLTKQGEYWRFVSGHFVYVSWQHWLLNTAGIFLLLLFYRDSQRHITWLAEIVFILFLVSTGLLLLSEQLIWYAGFSAILIGLFSYAAILDIPNKRIFSVGMIILLTIYIFMQLRMGELVDGGLLKTQTSSYAHAMGLFAGITYALARITVSHLLNRK